MINAYTLAGGALHQAERLQCELSACGIYADIVRNNCFAAYIGADSLKQNIGRYDFAVYFDKDKYISCMLEKLGVKLFNAHSAIRICDDKAATYIALSGRNIAMPLTLTAPLCYTSDAQMGEEYFNLIEDKLSYPIIVKECYGSLGKGVYKAENRKELKNIAEKLKCTAHLYQQCIDSSIGRDVRVIVVGGKFVAAMLRVSNGDFRSNIELGGKGEKIDLSEDAIRLSEKVADILGLDYCGIDLLFDESGEPRIVCEVNSNAFFEGMEKVTGVNVAGAYARHIAKVMRS